MTDDTTNDTANGAVTDEGSAGEAAEAAHPVDPLAGLVRADPPSPGALLAAGAVGLLTLAGCVAAAVAIARGR